MISIPRRNAPAARRVIVAAATRTRAVVVLLALFAWRSAGGFLN